MVCHSTDSEQFDADMKELLEEIERRELVTGEDSYGITSPYDVCNNDTAELLNKSNPITPTTQATTPPPAFTFFTDPAPMSYINCPQFTPPSSPVPFSSLVGQIRVDDVLLNHCDRDGIQFDLQLDDKHG